MFDDRSVKKLDQIDKKKRSFFALSRLLRYDIEEVKERAKVKFKLKSFAEIKEWQLDYLVNKLKSRALKLE